MIRKVPTTLGLAVVLLTGWDSKPVHADGPVLVKEIHQQNEIHNALKEDPQFLAATREKKVRLSTAVIYSKKPVGGNTEQRYVKTLHYHYEDGKTIRTVYNPETRKVEKIDFLDGYPTPPGTDEQSEARKIAEDQIETVKELRRATKDEEMVVTFLSPSIPDRKHPHFRKRLVTVYYTPKSGRAGVVWVTINLTDGKIIDP